MTMTDTNQLASLVQRKLQVLTLLARLGEQQLAVIDGGDMGLLMKLLAAKQALLVQLQELEKQLDPFRADDPESRTWASSQARAECQRQASECNQRLTEVVQLEQQAERQMVLRRDSAAARLQGVHSAAEASGAYTAAAIDSRSRPTLCDES
ncbi:MAG TPA: hypothetical protein VMP01_10655 [Pirellulaceae bacterium]|nr:hypothetical protein [Pirellulaceae bacterium]